MNKLINSEEYWNNRFLNDWNKYSGEEQTAFFARITCELLPKWLIKSIRLNNYTICDMGCACGEAVNVLAQFLNTEVSGMDFSEAAIKAAKQNFPAYHFEQGDVSKLDKDVKYNIIYCSNVLEHFYNPWDMAEKMAAAAKDYLILQMPFRENLSIDEHFYKFDTNIIPLKIADFTLVNLETIDASEIPNTLYPDQQILLVYSSHTEDFKTARVSDICSGVQNSDLVEWNKKSELVWKDKINEIEAAQEAIMHALQANYEKLKNDYAAVNSEFNKREVLIEKISKELTEQTNTVISLKEELATSLSQKEKELSQLKAKFDNLLLEKNELSELLQKKESIIYQARQKCIYMASTKAFRVMHFLFRIKYQFMKGSKEERASFKKWLISKTEGKGGDSERNYNPIWSVINILDEEKSCNKQNFAIPTTENSGGTPLGKHLESEEIRLTSECGIAASEYAFIKNVLNSHQDKKILIYPHVVYWEPLQTPQQLLKAFASSGWLCFFCEHPSLTGIHREVFPDLFIVHEKELLKALGNREVFVLLTWLGSISFINQIKNKQIWYHVLDKLDLFPYYDEYYLELHHIMAQQASYVSYVATPLAKCLQNRKDSIYLPNAVNPEDFLNIHEDYIPEDMKPILANGHKIIGYYGYLAEWMDYEMVRGMALNRPDYEFVFIGKAIYDTSKIENIPNIHLLGLKPYQELSDYAKFFDVATIPFVINEKMDCVSPIKFYEYCALGLPVVTSKMKDMNNFICDFVACADGIDEYLFYLDKFTAEECKEAAQKNSPLIAMQNTWNSRMKVMENAFNQEQQTILNSNYENYDVIILGVIDYDFRYQRPQHFATRFAENGHRVFYINANHFNPDSITEIQDNLNVINLHNDKYSAIHLTDWTEQESILHSKVDQIMNKYCIRDAVVIVDYPNWIMVAEYLRKSYGFKIVTDYMDDFTGFLNPAEALIKENCVRLLQISDHIVSSSKFLYDIAKKFNTNVDIIRNGTEFTHFNQAAIEHNNDRKIIGYYGAVAEWFDWKKVVYVAQNMPECDIIIIGHVTAGEKQLSKCSNIKLLGELPYKELPRYLEKFDVCLIPFDTTTDLIKATNPVKFYEYLSAGKKIVATEIPELEPFKDEYVYLANDNQRFLEYIKLCLSNKDTLLSKEDKISFAFQNDWQNRYECFSKSCRQSVPKVSIIVLTYNNLKINKICIQSILQNTAYPNYELIIVDNLSTDGTREYLNEIEHSDEKLKVIFNDENKGFAGGNNMGIREAEGSYIVLLNNDTIVTRGWLTSMTKHLENNASLGMCGPVTNSIGNEAKIKVYYHNIREMKSFAYHYTTEHFNEEFSNPNVLALFCTMIKREVIEKCGLLDEEYGVGMFEDDDYAEAVKQEGFTLAITEDTFIHHFEGASFKKLEDKKFREIYEQNKERFEKKWNKKWIMHEKREGITWDTNLDINLLNEN